MGGKEHRFGGEWTETKLEILKRYLHAYNVALKHQPSKATPFKRAYIDAFAGSGYRTQSGKGASAEAPQSAFDFPDLAEDEPQTLLDGSARLSLQVEPAFDSYIFIEKDAGRCAALEALKTDFPERADAIVLREGEANAEIRKLCSKDWRAHRAVLFLDPYGLQVEWATLEAIARTRAIDLWLLYPLGMGVNRMVTRTGEIPPSWRQRLKLLLGNDEWEQAFYRRVKEEDLFDASVERLAKVTVNEIGDYFLRRLREIFPGVADTPAVLRNSRGSPLYLLCFAAGNPKGAKPALRIAEYLLGTFAEPWPTAPTSSGPNPPGIR